jgi:hypothetical protein
MTFEFLVTCRTTPETDVQKVLADLLGKVLDDNLNVFDEDAIARMVTLRHERSGKEIPDENGGVIRYQLLGFALELPEEAASPQTVVREFAAALPDTPPIYHVVKFEDPLLQAELAQYGAEIFALEMKLRRVLSCIYLYAYQDSETFDLLRDETVQPMARTQPDADQMRAAVENQFFHLTFSQYVGLNQRPDPKLPSILGLIRTSEQYEVLRDEILRVPIEHEDDAALLAGLKESMEAIEQMRNCVAHNRRPTKSTVENYRNARPLLDSLLDGFMSRWQVAE